MDMQDAEYKIDSIKDAHMQDAGDENRSMLRSERKGLHKEQSIYSIRNGFDQQSISSRRRVNTSNTGHCGDNFGSLGEWILEFRWLGTAIILKQAAWDRQ